MSEKKKNFLLGIFVLAAIGCVIWALMFLNPTVGDAERTIKVHFTNIDKISIGTRVNYAGKPVGEVIQVNSVANPRSPDSELIYPYEVIISLDSSVKIYHSDEISIRTSGLLGERSIAITPKPIPSRDLKEIGEGAIVYSISSASVEETVSSFTALGSKAEVFIDQLNDILEASGDEIDDAVVALKKALERFDSSLQTAEEVQLLQTAKSGIATLETSLTKLNEEKFFDNISKTMRHFSSIAEAFDQPKELSHLVDNIGKLSESTAKLANQIDDLWPCICKGATAMSDAATNIRDFTEDLKGGKGNIGKFLSDDGLYLQMRGIFSKAETLMDDVNHYGVLFHLDRGWQRQRTRRANKLAEICSPYQFRKYFQEEISGIDTSISRVACLLERNDGECCLDDSEYSTAFYELLRRIRGIEERLELYNSSCTRDEPGICTSSCERRKEDGESTIR